MNFDNATNDTTATEQAFSVDAPAPKTASATKKKTATKAKAAAPKAAPKKVAKDETPAQRQRAADKKARDEAKAPGRKPTKKTAANAVVATDFGAADETPTAAALAAPEIPNPLAGAGAESTTMLKAAGKKTRAPRAAAAPKVGAREALDAWWNDDALPRTGPLTVRDLAEAYILFLESGGQTTLSTISSYKNDLKTAVAFFGEDTLVSRVGRGWRAEFDESKVVNFLKSGEPKAQPTILKMRRTFRMAVEWARANETTAYAVAP